MPRTLVVLRHAKAESHGPSDFERELAARGRADAAAVGCWLAGKGIVADHALVSAAVRTRQTWAGVADGAGWALEPELDRGLYAADVDTAVDLLRLLPEEAGTAVVVGHNPTMGALATLLDDGEGEPAALTDLAASAFPTSSAAVFALDAAWADLAPGTARLGAFHVGRG